MDLPADEVPPELLGTCGTVINHVGDMDRALDGVPIGDLSTAMNDPSPFTLLAFELDVMRSLLGESYANKKSLLDSNIFFQLLIYAFAAATLGGFDSPGGAVVGGLIVGVVTVLAGGYIGFLGEDLKLVAAFVLILVVLLVRPQGLFGRKQVQRV